MEINNNIELSKAVDNAIKESGMKKAYIAEQIGIKREVFTRMLNKKNFSLDDANKILDIIGLKTETKLIKKDKKN